MDNMRLTVHHSLLIVSCQTQILGMINQDQNGTLTINKTAVVVTAFSLAAPTSTAIAASSALSATGATALSALVTVKSTAIAAGTAISSASATTAVAIKGAAIAAAASPAFIPVVAGVGGCACGCGMYYGGRRLYNYCYPPAPQHIAQTEQNKAAGIKAQAEIELVYNQQEIITAEKEFKKMLLIHTACSRNASGIPIACQEAACKFSMIAGKGQADKVLSTFIKHAPQRQNNTLPIQSKL